MENSQKFSAEELDQIKKIQEKYSILGVELVQLKLTLKSTKDYLAALIEQETLIEGQIIETNTEEKNLAKELDAKYGAGSLDLESGVFTPQEKKNN